MYSNNEYNVRIEITLENGVYVFDEQSSTGKTRLCKELKKLRKYGEKVVGYTYGDDKLGIDLVKFVKEIKPVVIMLDKYDMYNNNFDKFIKEWGKKAVVLIDCKGDLNIESEWCTIEMNEDNIEVIQ